MAAHNDTKVLDLANQLDVLVKKVENINSEKHVQTTTNKCDLCEFIAKNEQVLKVHKKAKHTQPQKFKCCTCDFSCPTKEELTAHNDIYWDSHRRVFDSRKKRYYLEEIEKMESDGFTVKESFYKSVLKCDD